MIQINLLPWRETLREQRKRHFYLLLSTALISAIIIVVFVHTILAHKISRQQERNNYLQQTIDSYKVQLTEIEALTELQNSLMAKLELISELQAGRPEMVHVLDDLVSVLSDGTYLTKVNRNDDSITLIGQAESNTNVSQLMRSIERSIWILEPQLSTIKQGKDNEQGWHEFTLEATSSHPHPHDKLENAESLITRAPES